MSDEKILYIMRGVPSSGKSFDAKRLAGEHGLIFSTDDQWGKGIEEYKANWAKAKKEDNVGSLLGRYHRLNLELAVGAMKRGASPVVIDNTNIKKRDVRPYVEAGFQYDYDVRIEEPTSKWWAETKVILGQKDNKQELDRAAERLEGRNSHGVPKSIILKMLQRWHDLRIEDF